MNAERTDLPIVIRPVEEAALAVLARHFLPSSRAVDHAERFALQQRGDGVYLIAWHSDEPVRHLMIRWRGPANDLTGRYPQHTPYLEAAVTRPTYRSSGVGTRLIREAERRAQVAGYQQVGLTVSSKENPRARALYERLGYRDWGGEEYAASWEYETGDGKKAIGSGIYVYMIKAL